MDWNNPKQDFPLLKDSDLAYLDSAATSQKPSVALDAVQRFYETSNANVHRGIYQLSEHASQQYEQTRDSVQQFIHAKFREEIIFTSGTTASINTLAYSLSAAVLQPGDVILLSPTEHHSNLVPWQQAAQRHGATLEWFTLTTDMRIDVSQIEQHMHDRVKLVAVGHVSNALGTINPIEHIIAAAHAKQIPVVIDAAQSVPHMPVDVQVIDCDFLAFSGHKLCGPTGTGVLYGKREWLERLEPCQFGGDMINSVELTSSSWAELPAKFEAGTPNIAGVIGLGAAVEYLSGLGMQTVRTHVDAVYSYLLEQLRDVEGVTLYGVTDNTQRSSIAAFNYRNYHAHDVAQVLDQQNIAVRAGHHCAQPVMNILNVPATVRASVYMYTTKQDVDALISGLKTIDETLG